VDKMNRTSRESRRKQKEHFSEFLKLYDNEPAYFYFIDDYTGVPIVDENNGIYPLVITDAAEMVEKLFPMMLSGMILMRGAKSASILVDVLLDDNIKVVLPHWIEAAKDLIGYTVSPFVDSTKPTLRALMPLREKLINFVQYGPTENGVTEKLKRPGLSNEWAVETSLIKMIIEMHDPRHYFCDLIELRATDEVLWTYESNILIESPNQIDFKPPKVLKAILSGKEERRTPKKRETKTTNLGEKEEVQKETFGDRGYEQQLFEELGLTDRPSSNSNSNSNNSGSGDYSSGDYTDATSEDDMPGMIITTTKNKRSKNTETVPLEPPGTSESHFQREEEQQESMFAVESFNLDSVVKLRIQLDEQEAKLYSLRQKISHLDTAGDLLVKQEEKITRMIGEIINQKDILQSPTKTSLEKAKSLLLRICELEDRVLCREIEVGQLKNDVSFFELEASTHEAPRRRLDDSHRSSSSSSRRSSSTRSYPVETVQQRNRDEDIESIESNRIGDFDHVSGIVDEDDSTVGNSTMYNSSVDGYSAGYSAGMSRY